MAARQSYCPLRMAGSPRQRHPCRTVSNQLPVIILEIMISVQCILLAHTLPRTEIAKSASLALLLVALVLERRGRGRLDSRFAEVLAHTRVVGFTLTLVAHRRALALGAEVRAEPCCAVLFALGRCGGALALGLLRLVLARKAGGEARLVLLERVLQTALLVQSSASLAHIWTPVITMSFVGRSPPGRTGMRSMRFSVSSPPTSLPNTVCLLFKCGVSLNVMKN